MSTVQSAPQITTVARSRVPSSQISSTAAREARWLTRLERRIPPANLHSLDRSTRMSKRAFDIVFALAMLAVCWPLMLLVALLIKLTSPGPAIFRQERVGLNLRSGSTDRRLKRGSGATDDCERRRGDDRRANRSYGRHFTLYKFRTMRTDAERNGAQFAQKGDPRVTRLGRFLRKTRIDELPQLYNVLKGEMSVVGPRPERPEFIEALSCEIPDYLERLGLKPGLTGVAQVVNGYDNDIESFRRKVAYDLLYMRNCCLVNDLKILIRTVGVVLTGKGAL